MTMFELVKEECEVVAGGSREGACRAWAKNAEYAGAVVGGIVGTIIGRGLGGIIGSGIGGILGGYAGDAIYEDCMSN